MDPSAAHVFVASLETLDLADEDVHHLARVLRLRDGEVVTASDGEGGWRRGVWMASALHADGPVEHEPRAYPPITIGFAPVKGDRPDWTVQKLTELGVDRIVVLQTDRSVVKWDSVGRAERVARAAAMQSRQTYLPTIDGPVAPAGLNDAALAHFDGARLTLGTPTVLIGPEGGWSTAELAVDRPRVTLGPLVLRAETAAVAAAVLLTAARWGAP